MFGRRFELFKILGFPIRVDLSWFVVAILITWSLATAFQRFASPGQVYPAAIYWWMGLLGALGLFASVVLHELAHAVVARRYGMSIRGITLFIFGGVAEMEGEPPSAVAEFAVAIAGPIASLAIAILCFAAATLGPTSQSGPVTPVLVYLAMINGMLVLFNLVPAFPLDGGRVLRSLLWRWKDNLRWATLVSSRIGSGFGVFLIAAGIFRVLVANDLMGGLWMFLVGMFLRGAAQISYQQLVIRRSLEGEPVRRFMQTNPVSVPRSASVAELVEQYVYRYHFKLFPVVDNERLLGCVTTRQIKTLPREEWDRQSVGTLVEPCSEDNTVAPGTDALAALATMSRTGASRLMVVENGSLVGIIALKDMLKFLSLKVELEGERS